jgi:Ca2+-binding RTX toxin-like protein
MTVTNPNAILDVPEMGGAGVFSAYRIGDHIAITVAHNTHEYSRSSGVVNPVINTHSLLLPGVFGDFRQYRDAYINLVKTFAAGHVPSNGNLEGRYALSAIDMALITHPDEVDSDDDGLVLFLSNVDFKNMETLFTGSQVHRYGAATEEKTGDIGWANSTNSTFGFNKVAESGDSGGGYVLEDSNILGNRDFVMGVQVARPNTQTDTYKAMGSRFLESDWTKIHQALVAGQQGKGNVTADEPTNLVVGTVSANVFHASYRSDIILGRGGNDEFSDGDGVGVSVWANDMIYGGGDTDTMWGGRGNDLFHGGDHRTYGGTRLGLEDDGEDTVDYSRHADFQAQGITIRIVAVAEGSQTFHSSTLSDATIQADFDTAIFVKDNRNDDVDTLISIEKIKGTAGTDTIYIKSLTDLPLANAEHKGGLWEVVLDLNPTGIDNGDLIDLHDMTVAVKVDLSTGNERIELVSDATIGFTVKGAERVTGGSGGDDITGNVEANKLIGGNGADTLRGGLGNDIIDAVTNQTDGEADQLYGNGGAGSTGNDADIFRTNAGDVIHDLGATDIAVYFNGVRLAGGARQAPPGTAGDLTGHYDNGYTGLQYDYAQVGGVWILTVTAPGGGGQLVIRDFQDGEAGINLKTSTIQAPHEGSADERPPTAGDPLILDLDGDGAELTDIDVTDVYFDTNMDGFVERVGWVGPDDGLLARDMDGNGLIDNLSELFGTETVDGFTVLAGYDGNHDGLINASDAIWSTLRVWRDADTDGDTDPGELRTMAQVGITGISLIAEPVDLEEGGNDITFRGSFTWADASVGEIVSAFIKIAKADPYISGEGIFDNADVYLLPELSARDEVRSLRAAMDADPALHEDVLALVEGARTMASADFRAAFEDVLLRWAGVDGIDPESHGEGVDARHLAFVRTITGDPQYVRGAGGAFEDASYYPGMGATVETRFSEIVNQYMIRFGSQIAASEARLGLDADALVDGPFAGLFHGTGDYSLSHNVQHFSPDEIGFWVARNAPAGAADALVYFSTVMPFLQGIAYQASLYLFERTWAQAETVLGAGLIAGGLADAALLEFAIDRAHGTERALVSGTGGGDTLTADEARGTTFIGAAGTDLLIGGAKADTYVYAAGDGDDTIQDYDDTEWEPGPGSGPMPVDRLLMVGIDAADVTITADGDDILLTIAGSPGGTIRLVGQLAGTGIEEIVFADGPTYTASDIATLIFAPPVTAGDDEIYGTRFNDEIDGLAGDDWIAGDSGNDVLIGGLGDDTLYGGLGDDTYIYNAGDGEDVVIAASGQFFDYERLRLIGVDPDDVLVRRIEDGNLVFEIGGSQPGRITIEPGEDELGLDEIQFDGDVIWTRDELRVRVVSGQATNGDDHILGIDTPEYFGDRIAGGRGDDILEGQGGRDSYHYRLGDGHDTIIDYGGWWNGDNALVFDDLDFADLIFEQGGETQQDMVIHVDRPEGGSITIANGYNSAISQIWFADGTRITPLEIARQILVTRQTEGDDLLVGLQEDDVIHGLGGNDEIRDYGGDNVIDGGDGDDVIEGGGIVDGGAGADVINAYGEVRGGLGNDSITASGTIHYAAGDGNDVLTNSYATLRLADIDAADVTFSFGPTDEDLMISIGGALPGSILVEGQWTDPYQSVSPSVSDVVFGDGSRISAQAIADALMAARATTGDDIILGMGKRGDTIEGGLGDDELRGGFGSDTYVYTAGDGDDLIDDGADYDSYDRLILHGIDPDDVTTTMVGDDAVLTFAGGGSITLSGEFAWTGVERIVFDNGERWITSELIRQTHSIGLDATLTGTSAAETLTGTSASETYHGGAGDDILVDWGGMDVFQFGVGDGHDVIDYGVFWNAYDLDILSIDALQSEIDVTTLVSSTQFRILSTGETITAGRGGIDFVEFSDGTRWDSERIAAEAVIRGTSGNDNLTGEYGQIDERFLGGGGSDEVWGGGGNDTYIYRPGDGFLSIATYYGAEDLYGRTDMDTLWLRGFDPADVLLSIEPQITNSGADPHRHYYGQSDLVVRFQGQAGSIRVENNFDELFAPDDTYGLEQIRFDDGTIWSLGYILEHLGTYGTALPDILFSSEYGSGVIEGGQGNDRIYEAGDGNVIRWSVGDGDDRLIDATQSASLVLVDVDLGDATFSRDGDDLLVAIGGETIRIESQFAYSEDNSVLIDGVWTKEPWDWGIATIVFADEVTVTRETLALQFVAEGSAGDDVLRGSRYSETLSGEAGDDTIRADEGDDAVEGGDGADLLRGGDGDDLLTGGLGEDDLDGGRGSDAYVWTLGDGDDRIRDEGGRFDGIDELRLVGVDPGDVVFTRLRDSGEGYPYDSLQITILSTGEVITIEDQYFVAYLAEYYIANWAGFVDGPTPPPPPLTYFVRGVERIVFDDDTVVEPNDVGGSLLYANPDRLTADLDGLVNIDPEALLGNDIAPFDAMMRIVAAGDAAHGTIVLNEDGTLTFTPEASFLGLASFTYTVASGSREATATVTVDVIESVPDEGTEYDDELTGTARDDTIMGGAGYDIIDGAGGIDIAAYAGAAADFLIYRDPSGAIIVGDMMGNEGWDTLFNIETLSFGDGATIISVEDLLPLGTEADDVIEGTDRPDHLFGEAGEDLLTGGSADDRLVGGDDDDILDGGDGNDSLEGGAGADLMIGGLDDDYYEIDDVGDVAVENSDEGYDSIYATFDYTLGAGFEGLTIGGTAVLAIGNALDNEIYGNWELASTLRGLGGNDGLGGGEEADLLEGGDGNDYLYGGGGDDVMVGGAGDDTYIVEQAGDVVTEASEAGTDEVLTTLASYALALNVERLTGLLETGQTLTGNALDNILVGGIGGDTLDGGLGSDTAAWTWSWNGVTVDLGTGTTSGDADGDVLVSIENLTGGYGADTLSGNGAANNLDGGEDADLMAGRTGDDVYIVDNAGDVVVEEAGEGVDRIETTLVYYALGADVENLSGTSATESQQLVGNALANVIHGGAFDDLLEGGDGADLLVGGSGVDELTGGAGADTFRFFAHDSSLGAADRITDFVSGSDKIDLSQIDADSGTAGLQGFTFVGNDAFTATAGELRYWFNGTDTCIKADWDGDGAADLVFILSGDVVPLASDFVL